MTRFGTYVPDVVGLASQPRTPRKLAAQADTARTKQRSQRRRPAPKSRADEPPPASKTASSAPLFARIAQGIAEDVRRGRLHPGRRLPGSRQLADDLGVHRNTVLAAYVELERQGYVVTQPARGTFVVEDLPERPARKLRSSRASAALELAPRLEHARVAAAPQPASWLPPHGLPLLAGLPDPRLIPRAALARAYRRVLTRHPEVLDYGSPYGHFRLLHALGEYLRTTRGILVGDGELVITRGSQMAAFLAASALCKPGDVVAVEALGYVPIWQGLRLAGAELAPVPLDAGGLRVDHIEGLARSGRLRAVYVTPHHQYPTTVSMPAARRLELLSLSQRYGFAILEDDYDHEFHWSGRPLLPLASVAGYESVIYMGTMSKVLAPGLRLGYLVAPAHVAERVVSLRRHVDKQGDHAVEAAVAELFEDGEMERHAKRARRAYSERREVMLTTLKREFGDRFEYTVPPGGLALWVRSRLRVSAQRLVELASEQRIYLQHGGMFAFDGRPREFLRLGFPCLTPEEIQQALRTLAQIADRSA